MRRWIGIAALACACGTGDTGTEARCVVETEGQIRGVVRSWGRGWSDVLVTASSPQATETTHTNASGWFVFDLPPGTYEVSVFTDVEGRLDEPHTGSSYDTCARMVAASCEPMGIVFAGNDCYTLD